MRAASLLGGVAIAGLAMQPVCRAQSAKGDSTQSCLFIHETDHRDDDLANALAAHGDAVVGCLISELSGKGAASTRAEAALVLVRTITNVDPPLGSVTARGARVAIVRALRDRSFDVRVATVSALGEFGDATMIPALQSVATSDPTFSLRDYTASAIARIRKRTRSSEQ